LKRRAKWGILLSQKLQERSVVLRATSDEGHGIAVCRPKLHILTTIVESRSIIVRNKLIKLRNPLFITARFGLCDIYKKRLIWGAGKRAEEVIEVLLASRAGGYKRIRFLQVIRQGIQLYHSSAPALLSLSSQNIKKHTCSSAQHTGPVFHFGPHIPTSCFRTSSSGSSASPLSGHGSSGEKKLDFPQLPRMAQRPASWMGVNASLNTRVDAAVRRLAIVRRPGPIVDVRRRPASQYVVGFFMWSDGYIGMFERVFILCEREVAQGCGGLSLLVEQVTVLLKLVIVGCSASR